MRKWIIAVVVVAAAAAGLYFFGPFRGRVGSAAQGNLQTAPAERGDLTATIGATGVVRANQTAELTWQTSGTVGEVRVAAGEPITAGQVLAVLEKTSLPQNIILAEADLPFAHDIAVQRITVAALMTTEWIARLYSCSTQACVASLRLASVRSATRSSMAISRPSTLAHKHSHLPF